MDLLNTTKMQTGYTMGRESSGREHVVVMVKGTFTLPKTGGVPELAETQLPLIDSDTFTGEPGYSAPVYEMDYSFRKHKCDVLLNGSAYAPDGKQATSVMVGLKIGPIEKVFNVVGDRIWQVSGTSVSASEPQPFQQMPIGYDLAFGGVDDLNPDESKHTAYRPNPVGRGYYASSSKLRVDGMPLPNTEEAGQPVTSSEGNYRSMAFGPIGRGWEPRYKYAGTYDQNWVDEIFPFLPSDFDEAYFQAAPLDQQMPFPRNGEEVMLLNLTPEGRVQFLLPELSLDVNYFLKSGEHKILRAVADTIVLEPDLGRLMITWRSSLPLKRNMFEIKQMVVGKMSRGWLRARLLGKTYYPSLGEMVRSQRNDEDEEFAE